MQPSCSTRKVFDNQKKFCNLTKSALPSKVDREDSLERSGIDPALYQRRLFENTTILNEFAFTSISNDHAKPTKLWLNSKIRIFAMPRELTALSPAHGMRSGRATTIKRLLRALWPSDKPELRIRLILTIILLAVTALLNAVVPLLFSALVDKLNSPEDRLLTVAGVFLFGYILLYWFSRLLNESRWMLYGPIDQRLQRNLALKALEHLHGLSLRFHLSRKPGQTSRILDNGLRGLREILFDAVFLILPLAAEIVFVTVIMLFALSPVFAVVLSVALFLYAIVLVYGSERLRTHQRRAVTTGSRAHGEAVDSLLNFEAIKLFGNERFVVRNYDRSLEEVEILTVRSLTYRSFLGFAMVTIIASAMGLIVFVAVGRVHAGTMSIGEFVLVNAYLLQLVRPMERLGNLYRSMKQAAVDLEELLSLLDELPEINDVPEAKPLSVGPGEIKFDNVSFDYGHGRGALKNVTFTAEPGKTLAIVGPTGSGKSTIARLLFRFYDVQHGRIQIDGQDIKLIKQQSLRNVLSSVPQDPILFNDTIDYNIRFGRPDSRQVEVESAAKIAEISDFICSLPDRYDTLVGERGLKLSGGEKQRIAFARAILRNPKIVVLDEATSSLDSNTEKSVHDNFAKAFKNSTKIIIAHRLSTIIDAHKILVLKDGRIVEQGKHSALISHDGLYSELWKRQSEDKT